MIWNIFSDPHLGVGRQAHTTAESSKRLDKALFNAAMQAKSVEYPNFIAGDLFDKTFNSERVICQGIAVAFGYTYTLAGNHDETNREGTTCSLEVVQQAGGYILRNEKVGENGVFQPAENIFAIPHTTTQELFDKALADVTKLAQPEKGNNYLFLHCNRGSPIGDKSDSTLYVSDEQEDTLLKHFTRIFYGHEHRHRVLKGGRVVVIGNTHPTSFSDIDNKFRIELNTKTDEMQVIKIWDAQKLYLELEVGSSLPSQGDQQFILVKGSATRAETAAYIEQCWEAFPHAYAIRPMVTFPEEVVTKAQAAEPVNLLQMIESDLEGTNMLELFKELKHATN